ncbi:hypothetical protein AMK17_12790 [Streptomyces sp. CB00072]|nr:hypothetical protein AMK17_12790 [Streptomyces sp. CB00072]
MDPVKDVIRPCDVRSQPFDDSLMVAVGPQHGKEGLASPGRMLQGFTKSVQVDRTGNAKVFRDDVRHGRHISARSVCQRDDESQPLITNALVAGGTNPVIGRQTFQEFGVRYVRTTAHPVQ